MPLPDLDEWNIQTLHVMQALLGAVSPNFRMVTLDHEDAGWIIRFHLNDENEVDREEIDDLSTQFDAFQDGYVERRIEVVVTNETLQFPAYPMRTVYRRREY